jgi:hemoglobin-like flavoprotein
MIGIIIDRTLPLAELHTEKNKTIFTKGFYLQVYSRQKKSKTFFYQGNQPTWDQIDREYPV